MEKENLYYVYVYLDQRKSGKWTFKDKIFNFEPFYVGKGIGKRLKDHLLPCYLSNHSIKTAKIKKILKETGEAPIHYRLYENLTEIEAFELEKEIILHFGRINQSNGILSNLTNGGDGVLGLSQEAYARSKRKRKVYQYSLKGQFIKEWESLAAIKDYYGAGLCFKQVLKRNGTFKDSIWLEKYEGEIITERSKYGRSIFKMPEIKKIDRVTKKVIDRYKTVKLAAKEFGGDNSAIQKIQKCLNGKVVAAFGYFWTRSIDENIEIPTSQFDHKITKKDFFGNILKIYNSLPEASLDDGSCKTTIGNYYKGLQKDPRGFVWESNFYPQKEIDKSQKNS
jgi:hypothetical protein